MERLGWVEGGKGKRIAVRGGSTMLVSDVVEMRKM